MKVQHFDSPLAALALTTTPMSSTSLTIVLPHLYRHLSLPLPSPLPFPLPFPSIQLGRPRQKGPSKRKARRMSKKDMKAEAEQKKRPCRKVSWLCCRESLIFLLLMKDAGDISAIARFFEHDPVGWRLLEALARRSGVPCEEDPECWYVFLYVPTNT